MKLLKALKLLNNEELLDKFLAFQQSEDIEQKKLKTLIEGNTDLEFLQKCVNVASTNRNVLIEISRLDGFKITIRTLPDTTKSGNRPDLDPDQVEKLLNRMAGSSV